MPYRETASFEEIHIQKYKFHLGKELISVSSLSIFFQKKGKDFKYFIGYKNHDDDLILFLVKLHGCIKFFEETRYITFLTYKNI